MSQRVYPCLSQKKLDYKLDYTTPTSSFYHVIFISCYIYHKIWSYMVIPCYTHAITTPTWRRQGSSSTPTVAGEPTVAAPSVARIPPRCRPLKGGSAWRISMGCYELWYLEHLGTIVIVYIVIIVFMVLYWLFAYAGPPSCKLLCKPHEYFTSKHHLPS